MKLRDLAREALQRGAPLATFTPLRSGTRGSGYRVRAVWVNCTGGPTSIEAGWWPITKNVPGDNVKEAFDAANRAADALADPIACLAIASGVEP